MPIPMQTVARLFHRGEMLAPGDNFEVESELEARDLVAVGFARRRDVAAVEQAKPQESPESGRYARRDVRAKE